MDRDAFTAVFRAHHAAVLAHGLRRVDADTAREIAAETFTVARRRADAVPDDALRTYGPGERGSPWPTLSPDDATIAEQLALGHPASDGPAERLVAVDDLLRDQPMRPTVRAAVLRYLADTPTLALAGTTTDRLGRPGVAFSLDSDLGGLPTRCTMVVDPGTGRVLGSEQVLTTTAGALDVPVPSVIGYTAYRSGAWTDDLAR